MTPTRVVSLLASSTEVVVALGCGDRLVGRSHTSDHPDWVRRLPTVTAERPPGRGRTQGGHANGAGRARHVLDAEALAALAPDLVLVPAVGAAGDGGTALTRGLPGHPQVVPLGSATLADVWRDVRRVADALGVPERGVQLVSRLRQRMQAIAVRTAELVPRPRIAMLAALEPLTAAGDWHPELAAMAGAEDVFGTPGAAGPVLDRECLAAADVDIVWLIPRGYDLERTRAALPGLARRRGWLGLRAVREGRVFLGDGNAYFHRPGPRVAEALEILAEGMHPRAFRFGHEGTGWAHAGG